MHKTILHFREPENNLCLTRLKAFTGCLWSSNTQCSSAGAKLGHAKSSHVWSQFSRAVRDLWAKTHLKQPVWNGKSVLWLEESESDFLLDNRRLFVFWAEEEGGLPPCFLDSSDVPSFCDGLGSKVFSECAACIFLEGDMYDERCSKGPEPQCQHHTSSIRTTQHCLRIVWMLICWSCNANILEQKKKDLSVLACRFSHLKSWFWSVMFLIESFQLWETEFKNTIQEITLLAF